MNVVGPILHYGRTRSDTAALVEGERVITYGELADLVLRTASYLTAHGFQRGDRIGLCLRDTSDHLVALLAMAHIGAIAVPLDWRAPPPENARLIAGLGLACLLKEATEREVKGCPSIPVDPEWHRAVASANPATGSAPTWHDAFVISATSGSTGTPKFTVMTHLQYYFAIIAMWELMGLAGHHRFLCTLPLYYSGGRNSCIAHLLRGDSVILYSSLITPTEFLDVVNLQRITVAVGVPLTVRQLLAVSGEGLLLPGSTAFFCTGAPLHPEEKRQAARRLTPLFHERYGTAETLAISVLRPKDLADRSDSVGQPHSLAEIEIVDEDHRTLPRGVVGRLRFRGPGMGSPLPGSAAEANFRDGWFYPGEIARCDEAGYIFLQGRTSDVIIRRGAKIYPAEIEATLTEHADVIEAAVLGWRDPGNEEAVIAFVVTQGDIPASELLAHCRVRLTPYKVPRQFHFLEELPKNTAGKIDKTALAKRLERDGP
jgi:acyl-coenzyme A synthetase/AMP-(fatty) acid ligase